MADIGKVNAWSPEDAYSHFLHCCGSKTFASTLVAARPFASLDALLTTADEIWWQRCGPSDWEEAFQAHPRIGDRNAAVRESKEQAGAASADDHTKNALREANAAYEKRFPFIYIVCASGKSGAEMLNILKSRLGNDIDVERRVAAEEQRKITALRLKAAVLTPAKQ